MDISQYSGCIISVYNQRSVYFKPHCGFFLCFTHAQHIFITLVKHITFSIQNSLVLNHQHSFSELSNNTKQGITKNTIKSHLQ